MKKLSLLSLLLIIGYASIKGQNYSTEFGKIGKEEIDLTQYPEDRDAEAVVLFDKGKSRFVSTENSFDIEFQRETRIKILSEAGLKWAEIKIPYYQENQIYEQITEIEAYTYNFEDGELKRTVLSTSNLFVEKVNNYWSQKKLVMPNVKPGSIIEIKYKINSQYLFNLRDWEFQWEIPVVYSEYEVRMIPFYEYTYLFQGAKKFDAQKSYTDNGIQRQFGSINFQDVVNTFIMKNVPAFKDEEFITSLNDYIIKMDFQLSKIHYPNGTSVDIMTTWDEMEKTFLKDGDFGKYIEKSEKLAPKTFDFSTIKDKTDTEKFESIIDYIKTNYSWDKNYSKFASKAPNKFTVEKNGNCADINLFTIALLKTAGIEAYPVLISTRKNGKIAYDYPYSHFFNWVVILAKIGDKKILSDATNVNLINERIPVFCINDKGLVVKEGKVDWVGLECSFASETTTEINVEFGASNKITGKIIKSLTEYFGADYRDLYADNKDLFADHENTDKISVEANSIQFENLNERTKPYVISYSFSANSEVINDKIYIDPFFENVISDNPLKQNKRTYPIDINYPFKKRYKAVITIPDNYAIEFNPEPLKISNQLFELNYSTETEGNKLIVSFDYYFKSSIYPATDYGKIKYYFTELIKKGNEKIVLAPK